MRLADAWLTTSIKVTDYNFRHNNKTAFDHTSSNKDYPLQRKHTQYPANKQLHIHQESNFRILDKIISFFKLFHHQESNQKYTFVTPEGKPGAVPVHSLIAREKPGSESPKVTF